MLFSLIIVLALALELLLATPGLRAEVDALGRRLHALVPQRIARFALAALVITFAAELAVISRAARAIFGQRAWFAQLPIPITYAIPAPLVPKVYQIAFVSISALEAVLLGAFLLAVTNRPWRRADSVASAIAAVAIAALAVSSPAMTSGDMYAYVGDALLGPNAAYSPPSAPLPGEYAVIHRMWGLPLLPAAYGSVWLWWNSAVVGLVTGLHAKLIVLRLVNAGALALTLGALRQIGIAPRFIAATAVNPAIAFYYLTNGHNDLLVIAIILCAMTFAARSPLGAGIVAGIGASIKLTLVLPAAAIAIVLASLPRRLVYLAAMFATAAAIAIVLGGKPYLHALTIISSHYDGANKFARVRYPHVAVALLTSVLTILAIFTGRTYKSIAFGFSSLAQAFYPWYTIWGLPYAVARSDVLATLLVGFPLITAALEIEITSKVMAPLVIIALLCAIGVALIRRRKLAAPLAKA